jgi:hypothetical protein
MDRPSLNDPAVFPDDAVLARRLAAAKAAWDAFMALLKNDYPLITAEWRYYNDGKSWLFKVTQKKKTVCWVAVWDKFFSASFYLNAKAEDLVRASSLDQPLKDGFLGPDKNSRFRAIRAEVRKKSDLKAIKELIGIKLKLK